MDILSYLLELLQQSKEVGITGLGTFYKKKFPGRYDKETQSFLPPSYALQFSSEVKNDEALINFVATKRNISVESASYYISQFVDEVKQKLEEEHEAELENVGRLFFTEHEGLSFEAAKNINYGSEFYGLPSLPEAAIDAPQTESSDVNEEVYDEIAEVPQAPAQPKETAHIHPIIENVELDEVQDDLRNTLKHTAKANEEVTDAPEFIKEQHAEHPNRFGHTPEDEEAVKALTNDEVEVPESVIQQHEENPNRFGHTPETEEEKTYINLEDETPKAEPVIEAPEFIKEQHAEHPNRFGHDPIVEETYEEEKKSIWPKVILIIFGILLIGVILYFVKPDWFKQQAALQTTTPTAVIDSQKNEVDTLKAKQDSIARTDSILKANQVQQNPLDTAKKIVATTKNESPAPKTEVVTDIKTTSFDVIVYASKNLAATKAYVANMKKNGYNAKIANMPGAWHKVSIASFKTQQEAETQKDILQKKLKGKGFYVQQIINNTQP
ncbi:MAG: SPOR domain-containing protein [Pedobacter sp.]|uniref:HU domain-containing protein n=1 Tax=Pedobacter agri TaxID=454586 RepID=UPI0011FC3AFB|nr:SPOR domain-containing protein [Pedobacter agri]RZL62121.1 MAG: SPOR domain-containing protein [Pedobacter sp.]